jgi:hypothetical protein
LPVYEVRVAEGRVLVNFIPTGRASADERIGRASAEEPEP